MTSRRDPRASFSLAASVALSFTAGAASAQGTAATEVVVVTATRSERALEDVPASIAVQDVDRLRRAGFTQGTDEYRGVAGVSFRRGEGDGDEFPFVSVRGSTGTDGSLSLIDGIPIVGLYEETQLNEIPYDAIERVEIVKGPVSALYGRGALYGATNYITNSARTNDNTISVAASDIGYRRAAASMSRAIGEQAGVLVSGSLEDSSGWRDYGGRRIANLLGKGEFELSPATSIEILANFNDRESELPNGLPIDVTGRVLPVSGGREGFLGYGEPRNEMTARLAALRVEHDLGDNRGLTVTGSFRDIDRDVFLNFFDPFGQDLSRNVVGFNGFRGTTDQLVTFAEVAFAWQPSRHNVVAGLTAERARAEENIRWSGQNGFTFECGFTFYLIEVDYTTGEVLNADHPCFETDRPQTRDRFNNAFWGAFVQDEMRLTDDWTLTIGGRYDSFRRTANYFQIPDVTEGGLLQGKSDAFSPKLALSRAIPVGQVYLAYGRGFNSNFGATFEWDPVQYARPESRPTTLDSYEFGVKARVLDDRLALEAAIYRTEQKNRRQVIPNPAAENDFTQPSSLVSYGDLYESRGAEFSGVWRPSDGTQVTFAFSYIDPLWKSYTIAAFAGPLDFSGNTPTGVAKNIAYVRIEQQLGERVAFRASYESYGDYYYTVDNRYRDGAYDLLGLGLRISPRALRGIDLDLSMTNAADEEYYFYFGGRNAPTYAMPGMPREFRLTLSGRF